MRISISYCSPDSPEADASSVVVPCCEVGTMVRCALSACRSRLFFLLQRNTGPYTDLSSHYALLPTATRAYLGASVRPSPTSNASCIGAAGADEGKLPRHLLGGLAT